MVTTKQLKGKILILLALLLLLVGCEDSVEEAPLEERIKTEHSGIISNEEIICRDGVKIWIANSKTTGGGNGLTSEIIGTCEVK